MSLLPVIDPDTIKQHCIAVNYENNSGHAAFVKTRRRTVTVTCASTFHTKYYDIEMCCSVSSTSSLFCQNVEEVP